METTERGTYRIKLNHQPSGGREWVAEITDADDPKYGLSRSFQRDADRNWSGSGKTGTTYFEVEEGKVYEANNPWKDRYFFRVVDGEQVGMNKSEVLDFFAAKVAR